MHKGLSFSSEWGGPWKSWGSQNFFMRNRGVPKISRDFWMATNFNENFVQWNSPKNAYFLRYAHWGYMFLQRVAPEGGHKIFDHQIGGSQKYWWGTFRNSWPPYSRENGGPPKVYQSMTIGWIYHFFNGVVIIKSSIDMYCTWSTRTVRNYFMIAP